VDVDQFDALSTSMLLPSEKQRKKDRGQVNDCINCTYMYIAACEKTSVCVYIHILPDLA
jgi:hypothetical protein